MSPAQFTVSAPLRNGQDDPNPKGGRHDYKSLPQHPGNGNRDDVQQTETGALTDTHPGAHFAGVGSNGFIPPDTNMAVGPNHIVQTVNSRYAIFSKAGALLAGPHSLSSLWAPLTGTGCATNNAGDVVAQYDVVADRFVITQLGGTSAPFSECIAISQTSDPTGSFWLYSFDYGTTLNDYQKVGIWPTATNGAYLVSANLFDNGQTGTGSQLCAYDRTKMIAGDPTASAVCYNITVAGGFVPDAGFLPSDLDGSTPPVDGTPGYFVNLETNSSLRLYALSPNFANPSASSLTVETPDINIASFAEACGGGSCIPQVGTGEKLDSLGDRLMYRLAFRNLGNHEALVVNHSIASNSVVGVRWYELRAPVSNNTAFTLFQQGTYAPDSIYRWMGSAAMDNAGDMAIGYSASNSTLHPSIRYAGRVPTDAPGQLEAEVIMMTGAGSQTSIDRWGDYSAMRIDPSDDCTFWYTNEYLPSNGTNWQTYFSSFKFTSCVAAPNFSLSASPASQVVVAGNGTTYTANVSALNGFTDNVGLTVTGLPAGATASFNPTSINTSGSSTLSITTTAATPPGTYTLTITGTSTSPMHSTTVLLKVPDFSLSANPGSQTVAAGNGTTYTATVAALNGFTGNVALSVSGLPSGVGGTFNPTSVTTSGPSTLTITTTAAAAPGTYTLTITGTGPFSTHSTTVSLTINPSPDFSISATPGTRTVVAGNGTTYTASVAALNGFTGSVALSVSGFPTGAGGTFNPTSITTSGNSTLTITTTAATAPGTYTLTITGTGPSTTHSTTVSLTINAPAQDFSISATPGTQTVVAGNGTTYTASVSALNGFTGNVALSVSGFPTGAGGTFNPTSISTSGTSTLTITTTAATTPGTYTLTITGTGPSTTHSTTVSLTINPVPDFSISATPGTQTVVAGNGTTYTASVSALNGFTGSVALSVSGFPTGAGGTFNPTSISTSGNSTLTITTTAATAPGTYTLTITGTGPSSTHSTTVSLTINPVPDFSISATPGTQTVVAGNGTTYTTSVSALNGFTGSVALSVSGFPTGAGGTFNPTSISTSGNSTLTITTTAATAPGTYTLTITGTGPSSTHSTTVSLTINPVPDFSISATPGTQTVVAGNGTTYTASVAALNGFTGNVALSVSGFPTGAGGTFNPTSISTSGNSTLTITTTAATAPGTYTLTITGTNNSLTHSTTVSLTINPVPDFSISATPGTQTVVAGNGTTYTTSVAALNGFTGSVALSVSGFPTGAGGTFNPTSISTSGTSALTITTTAATVPGTYTLTITGTGPSSTHTTTVTLVITANAADFTIVATPSTETVRAGESAIYSVTVAPVNGFTGTINFSVARGLSGTFSPASVTLNGTGSATTTFTKPSSASSGNSSFSVGVVGTSGSLSHQANVTMVTSTTADFSIAATPSQQTISAGGSTTYNVTTTGISGFTGFVNLSVSGLPSGATGTFNPAVTAPGSSTLTVTTTNGVAGGTYTLTITGTASPLSHSTTVTLTIGTSPDFSISATPASQSVVAGNGTTFTATVTPQNGFTDTVNLTVSGFPTGAGGSFNPTSITTSGTSTLTVTTAASVVPGTYTLTITGTDGALVHSTTASLTVNPPPDFSISATPSSQAVIVGNGTTFTATVTGLNGFTDTVNLSVSGFPAGAGGTFNPTSISGSGGSTLTVTTGISVTPGTYPLTITGTDGALVHSTMVSLTINPPPDFSLGVAPASQTVTAGNGTTYTATVGALNGFTGSVSLNVSGLPSGATGTFSPTSISTSGTSSLTITTTAATAPGTYTLTITGTSGLLTHTSTVSFVVNAGTGSDFTISATPVTETVRAGESAIYFVTVTPVNGFTGTVTFSIAKGLSGTFSPASVTLTGSGSATTMLTKPSSPSSGNSSFSVGIIGTSGSLSHQANVTMLTSTTADFSIAATPSSQTVSAGGTTTYNVTVAGVSGFSGYVNLGVSGLPADATASFSPSLTAPGSSTLTITAGSTTGTFSLTITGNANPLTHSVPVSLTIQ
jgi:hypothetical protein